MRGVLCRLFSGGHGTARPMGAVAAQHPQGRRARASPEHPPAMVDPTRLLISAVAALVRFQPFAL